MVAIAVPHERHCHSPNRVPDTQRERVYAAERLMGDGSLFSSLAAVQEWIDEILASDWWKKRFPKITKIIALDGRGRNNGIAGHLAGHPGIGYVRLPKATRHRLYILHEMAHVAQPQWTAWHGKHFCRVFMALVRRWMGRETAHALRNAFRRSVVFW
jgi:putative metallohydrolase (TIGR04338 family)